MTSSASATHKTSTTVFSGFLGSGKTTIILNLIEQLQGTENFVYIKNEIGSEDIDGAILRGKHIKTKELLNGCICCTLVGPFVAAIDEIIDTIKPTQIIIEASGAADPSALALMIDNHPRLHRNAIISIIDVANFEGYMDISMTARNQASFTDLIVFNKTELVDLEQKRRVVGYIRELNPTAPILEAPEGKLEPALVFDTIWPAGSRNPNQQSGEHSDTEAGGHHHHSHLEQDGIETFSFTVPNHLPSSQLPLFADSSSLPPYIFRGKAILTTDDGKQYIFNRVGLRTTVVPTEEKFADTALVVIGFHLADHKEEITAAVNLMCGRTSDASA